MRAALAAGGRIVNDVSGLTHDPLSASVVAEQRCPVVLMHMRGTPASMNAEAVYQDVVAEVRAELSQRVASAIAGGNRRANRSPSTRASDLPSAPPIPWPCCASLPDLASLGFPLLVGVSPKKLYRCHLART